MLDFEQTQKKGCCTFVKQFIPSQNSGHYQIFFVILLLQNEVSEI